MEPLEPLLAAAGVAVAGNGTGARYWATFEVNVRRLLNSLDATASSSE